MIFAPTYSVIRIVTRLCSNVSYFNTRNQYFTAKLLKQGYRYYEIRKAFSKFYHEHSELIEKYNIDLIKDSSATEHTRADILW